MTLMLKSNRLCNVITVIPIQTVSCLYKMAIRGNHVNYFCVAISHGTIADDQDQMLHHRLVRSLSNAFSKPTKSRFVLGALARWLDMARILRELRQVLLRACAW